MRIDLLSGNWPGGQKSSRMSEVYDYNKNFSGNSLKITENVEKHS